MKALISHNNDIPAKEEPLQGIFASQTSTGGKGTASCWGKSLKEMPVFTMQVIVTLPKSGKRKSSNKSQPIRKTLKHGTKFKQE